MGISIRPYTPSDYEACRRLWSELTEYHREIYGDTSIGGEDPGEAFHKHLLRSDLAAVGVADLDQHVVGMVGLLLMGADAASEEAEIEPLIVSSTHRSRGIGRLLLNHAIEEAKTRGVRFLNVRPVARNADGMSFFVKAGFTLVGRIELFQDLHANPQRAWKDGLTIHGTSLRY